MTATLTAPAPTHSTREAWLLAAVQEFTPWIEEQGGKVPVVRVSVGFPAGGRKNVIGQCHYAAEDGVAQIFVHPSLKIADRVLDVLLHEVIHACTPGAGHKGDFARLAKGVGLTGKMTATVASDDLRTRLEALAEDVLGVYPHAVLEDMSGTSHGPKTQSTRMLKAECAEGSGYKVRLTRVWLEEFGAPICPCHEVRMIEG
jgi:hypothetical protein